MPEHITESKIEALDRIIKELSNIKSYFEEYHIESSVEIDNLNIECRHQYGLIQDLMNKIKQLEGST
jgi:hypothetical protein